MSNDVVPLLMEAMPGLSEVDARAAATGCVGEEVLDENGYALLVERTFYLSGGSICSLWAIAEESGSAAEGDFDIDTEELYVTEAEARSAWGGRL